MGPEPAKAVAGCAGRTDDVMGLGTEDAFVLKAVAFKVVGAEIVGSGKRVDAEQSAAEAEQSGQGLSPAVLAAGEKRGGLAAEWTRRDRAAWDA